ncbi:MAG: hypothetical protein PHV17_00480 [Candidatus Omnitrophica bacterium]|nr:hypothetical protein [Candidatus Omnitrophota bacterium]
MKKSLKIFKVSVFLLGSFLCFQSSFSEPATVNALIERSAEFDGKKVSLTGEVIGDCLKSSDGMWINLLSGADAIGVFVKSKDKAILDKVKNFGSYKTKGDILEVEGTFYRYSPSHANLALYAETIKLVSSGYVLKEYISPIKIRLIIIFFIIYLTLYLIYLIKVKYNKNQEK